MLDEAKVNNSDISHYTLFMAGKTFSLKMQMSVIQTQQPQR